MNIGKNIFTLRREKRWTQAELAEKLGVSDQTVSKWENGQTAPDVSQFPVLARLFGVSIDRLFGYQSHSYDEEVEAILKAADACGSTRREIELLTDGLARYPNSAKLRTSLAFSLLMLYRISEDGEERRSAIERAVSLCGEALQTGGDPRELDEAMHMLCRIRTDSRSASRCSLSNTLHGATLNCIIGIMACTWALLTIRSWLISHPGRKEAKLPPPIISGAAYHHPKRLVIIISGIRRCRAPKW